MLRGVLSLLATGTWLSNRWEVEWVQRVCLYHLLVAVPLTQFASTQLHPYSLRTEILKSGVKYASQSDVWQPLALTSLLQAFLHGGSDGHNSCKSKCELACRSGLPGPPTHKDLQLTWVWDDCYNQGLACTPLMTWSVLDFMGTCVNVSRKRYTHSAQAQ